MARSRKNPEPVASPYPLPRAQGGFFGHQEAESSLLEAYRGGRLHHAWLLGGCVGIGKATLAYRMARFTLAHPHPESSDVRNASDLAIDTGHPVFRQIEQGIHPDCMIVEHMIDDEGKARKTIGIDEIRNLSRHMLNTAGAGGWRVAIIDPVDDLNINAANALLKLLEEPPARCLFLLVAHQPGRLLATLRSRCQRLMLAPLSNENLQKAVRHVLPEAEVEAVNKVAPFALGSVRVALDLLTQASFIDRNDLFALLENFPHFDVKALQRLAEAISRKGEDAFSEAIGLVEQWCGEKMKYLVAENRCAEANAFAQFSAKLRGDAGVASVYNLDRRAFLLTQLTVLSRLMRAREAA